jgi:hypothetical protein
MHGSPVCVCIMCLEGGGKDKERNVCTACFDVCNIESDSGHTLFLLSREIRLYSRRRLGQLKARHS